MFNKITHIKCPGCGISRMFISLLYGDLKAAWYYNCGVICLAAPVLAIFSDIALQYITKGIRTPHKWATYLCYIAVAALLLFGIIRNLPFWKLF